MRKLLFIIISISAMLTFAMQAEAQFRPGDNRPGNNRPGPGGPGHFDREAFVQQRNVYITEKVGLTAEEAAVFIPMDNELMHKKFEAGRDCRRLEREIHRKQVKTDDDFKKMLQCFEDVKATCDKLDKEYFDKFKKILSAEQIIKYQAADREFIHEFMRKEWR